MHCSKVILHITAHQNKIPVKDLEEESFNKQVQIIGMNKMK